MDPQPHTGIPSIDALNTARDADNLSHALGLLQVASEHLTASRAMTALAATLSPGREKFDAVVAAQRFAKDAYTALSEAVDGMDATTRALLEVVTGELDSLIYDALRIEH